MRTTVVILAATFALSAPLMASASEHGSMNMEMKHDGMMSMGKMIHSETVDGVKVMFHLIDMKEKLKGMQVPAGMTDTHHLMIMFSDAKSGKMLSSGQVKVKIIGPDKSEQVKTMMGMNGGFGSDVNLSAKGKYGIMTKFLLSDGKVRSCKFWYEVK